MTTSGSSTGLKPGITVKLKPIAAGLAFCVLSAHAAPAQTTIDVSKITCEQFLLEKVANPTYIALWISGYYNGKRNNTVLDVQGMEAHLEKVKNYCIKNYKTPVMQAIETVSGGGR